MTSPVDRLAKMLTDFIWKEEPQPKIETPKEKTDEKVKTQNPLRREGMEEPTWGNPYTKSGCTE